MNKTITVTENDLMSALTYGGYEDETQFLMALCDVTIIRPSKLISFFFKDKAPVKPAEEIIEKIADVMGQSQRVVRSSSGNYSLILYYSDLDQQMLLHEVQKEQEKHLFTFLPPGKELISFLAEWFDKGAEPVTDDLEENVVQLEIGELNKLYKLTPQDFEEIQQDEEGHRNIKQFASDFSVYGQDIEQCALFSTDDPREIDRPSLFFFLPGALCTWLISFEEAEDDGRDVVIINPMDQQLFLESIHKDFLNYLSYSNAPSFSE